jgi:hypothetical protein
MKMLLFPIAVLCLCLCFDASAQDWMSGYSYRKKITVVKSKVQAIEVSQGASVVKQDLPDFPVLVEIQDNDLIHVPGACSNKMRNVEGRDISFALSGAPAIPLNFQLESYDPYIGKLTCWVRISSLSATGTSTPATSFYFYYGSVLLHDPFGLTGNNVWAGDFSRVWHLKCDVLPATSKNAQSGIASQAATGSAGINENNFTSSRIGTGIHLDGAGSFYSGVHTGSIVTVSAWIYLNALGTEQVIIANDSINGQFRNGYIVKVDANGKLTMDLYRSMATYNTSSSAILDPGKWYHIAGMISGTSVSLLVNGSKVASKNNVRVGNGGSVSIGRGKYGSGYYSGFIDELRIQKTSRPLEWLKTQYVNQDNPSLFLTVSEEEYHPSEFSKFVGPFGGSWAVAANWSNGSVPLPGTNVIIPSGKSVRISGSGPAIVNSLVLKTGSLLRLSNHLEINCALQTDVDAVIKLDDDITLKCSGNILNNGSISMNQTTGKLVFSGNTRHQFFSGQGLANVCQLENRQALSGNELILNSQIHVSGFVKLTKGILNCRGNLTLLAQNESISATILPVPPDEARIVGNVHVQQFIAGSYPAPASARNWRLLSSPVYTDSVPESKLFNLSAYKTSMFITGAGGISNGFDASPLNSGTIYLHDQSLAGNLSQKYITIPNIDAKLVLGKGIYIFSRGSRTAPNAYFNQIQQSPFSNPDSYCLTHTGQVYSGDLSFQLSNKNTGTEGDGFNLLGNPYPGSLIWGNLAKVGLSPFVWLYDPLNNDYNVSDDPDTRIPVGTGFFVKVVSGQSSGSIKFSEMAKVVIAETAGSNPSYPLPPKPVKRLSYLSTHTEINNTGPSTLIATINRRAFSQQYHVSFEVNGNDDLDDNDAIKLGEGHINIAGTNRNRKLAIERRSASKDVQRINLYIAGWETGDYTIDLKASTALRKSKTIMLTDNYLKHDIEIKDPAFRYTFKIDTKIPETQGSNRFVINLKTVGQNGISAGHKDSVRIYPNPVLNKLFFKSSDNIENVRITVADMSGRIIATHKVEWKAPEPSIDCSSLIRGVYVITIYDENTSRTIKIFKVMKE